MVGQNASNPSAIAQQLHDGRPGPHLRTVLLRALQQSTRIRDGVDSDIVGGVGDDVGYRAKPRLSPQSLARRERFHPVPCGLVIGDEGASQSIGLLPRDRAEWTEPDGAVSSVRTRSNSGRAR